MGALEALVVVVGDVALASVVVFELLSRFGGAEVVATLVGTTVGVVDGFTFREALDVETVVVGEFSLFLDLHEAFVEVLVCWPPRVPAAGTKLVDEDLVDSVGSKHLMMMRVDTSILFFLL